MSHPNLAVPGNSSTVSDTQFDDITSLRNAEERAKRVFDTLNSSPGRVNGPLIAEAYGRLTEAFMIAERAVATPTRHTLPEDTE